MRRDYQRWYSPSLQRDMELLVFGHGGMPVVVFPGSMGRFFEYEDHGMIQALADPLGQGAMQALCVDSVDAGSWYNKGASPADRVVRHMACESYILNETVPLIRSLNRSASLTATGCGFGGWRTLCRSGAFRTAWTSEAKKIGAL